MLYLVVLAKHWSYMLISSTSVSHISCSTTLIRVFRVDFLLMIEKDHLMDVNDIISISLVTPNYRNGVTMR